MREAKSILLTPDFAPTTGGIQTYVYELFSLVPNMDVMAPAYRNLPRENVAAVDQAYPGKVHRFAGMNKPITSRKSYLLTVVLPAVLKIKTQGYKRIFCGHSYPIGLNAYYAWKWFGIPYVLCTHAMEVVQIHAEPEPTHSLYTQVLLNAERVATVSQYTRSHLLAIGVPEEKVVMVYPGADPEVYVPGEPSEELIKMYNLQDKFVLLTMGRIVERKGHDQVIAAVAKLREHIPNLVYLIAGRGPHEETLRRQVKELGVEEQVVFAGFVPDEQVLSFYQTADVFAMISRELTEQGDMEGFGIVFLEANACEKPVIGGNSGGVPDAVAHGVSGLLVDPLDVDDLCQAIVSLYESEALRNKLGTQGRRRVIDEFSWAIQAQKLEQLDGGKR